MLVTRPSHFPAGYAGCAERFVTLADGVRLRLVESGPSDGPPVLLVHGFGASAFQWRVLMPALATAGWRVVAPDLPGHGFSQLLLPDGEYSRGAYASRMWMVADELGLGTVPVIGHSMGGAVAAEMAWQHPERLPRLALLSPAGFGEVTQRARWLRLVPDAVAPMAQPFATRAAARVILRDVYGPDSAWSARDEEELLAPYAQPEIFRAMLRTLKEFDWSLHDDQQLARLPAGTLVVFGTHDRVVQPVALEARVPRIPHGRLVVLPRVGHLPHVEAGAQVATLLEEHFRALRLAGA